MSKVTESVKIKKIGAVPEALLIAALTGGAYWLTFRYEAAYIGAFGLPPHLVEVSLQTVLTVTLAVSGVIWILFWITNLVVTSWPEHPAIQEKVFRIGLMLLFPLWHLLNYGFRTQDWLVYVIPFTVIVIFEIAWPFLIFRDKPTFRERIIADEIAESGVRERGIAGRIFTSFGPSAYGLLVLLVLGSLLANAAGKAKAFTQKEFYVFASDPNIAVIRMYGDTILAVRFDRVKNKLKEQVIIQKISTEGIALKLEENVGPFGNIR